MKKLFGAALAIAVLPCMLFATGCKDKAPAHTHNYLDTTEITTQSEKAYNIHACSCGKKRNVELTGEYIVVNADNAQDILDGADGKLSGKTIVFDGSEGAYGSLWLRSTYVTVDSIVEYNIEDRIDYSVQCNIASLQNNKPYHYFRTIEDVRFVATNDAVFNGVLTCQSKDYISDSYFSDYYIGAGEDTAAYDYVKYVECDSLDNPAEITDGTIAFGDHVLLKKVIFENLHFEGENGRVFFFNTYDARNEEVTFKKCSFETETPYFAKDGDVKLGYKGYAALMLYGDEIYQETFRRKVTIENCSFVGHYQGINISYSRGLNIKNCTFDNSRNNAICLTGNISGDVNVEGCEVLNSNNRAILINACRDAYITIRNNTFTQGTIVTDNGKELLIVAESVHSELVFEDNKYGKNLIANTTLDSDLMLNMVVVLP